MQTFPCTNPKCPNKFHYTVECPNLPQGRSYVDGSAQDMSVALNPPPSPDPIGLSADIKEYTSGGNDYSKAGVEQSAKEDIIDTLENGYSGYYSDLHNETFNTNYFIVGTGSAKEALEEYGVFDAIERVQEYEDMQFGERQTDLSNPEALVNMLYYVVGDELMSEMYENSPTWDENYDNVADDELNEQIAKELKEAWF